MRRFEMWLGLSTVFVSLFALFWVIPRFIEPSDFSQVSPALLPRVATSLIGILGALMFLSRLISSEGNDIPMPFALKDLANLGLVVLIFVVGSQLILKAGFLIGGVALVAALMVYLKERNWITILLVSGLTPAVLWVIFEFLIGSNLP